MDRAMFPRLAPPVPAAVHAGESSTQVADFVIPPEIVIAVVFQASQSGIESSPINASIVWRGRTACQLSPDTSTSAINGREL